MKRLIKKLLSLPAKQKILMLCAMALASVMCLAFLLWILSVLPFNITAVIASACLGLILVINGFISSLPRSSTRANALYFYIGGLALIVTAVAVLVLRTCC